MVSAMKKSLSLLLSVVLILSLSVAACAANDGVFSDVPEDAWYAEAAVQMNERGFMIGTGDGISIIDIVHS